MPAQSAEIGITDKILTRITTPETVSKVCFRRNLLRAATDLNQIQSTFMIDLQQISLALKLATYRSLLIIDEFGKGTDLNGQHRDLRRILAALLTDFLIDGAGLACGIFEYLLNLGHERPKVLAATHFHEIFESGFLPPRPHLAFGHMEIRVDEKTQEAGEQITYLYKSVPSTLAPFNNVLKA